MMNSVYMPFNHMEPGLTSMTAGRKVLCPIEGHSQLSSHDEDLFIPGKSVAQFLQAGQLRPSSVISVEAASELLAGGEVHASTFTTGGPVNSSPCIGPDGTIYVGSNDRKLYAIKDGKKLWDYETQGCVPSSPCMGPYGTVYVGSIDGNVYELCLTKDLVLKRNESEPDVEAGTSLEIEDGWLTIDGMRLRIHQDS